MDVPLNCKDYVKYLGILIDSNLSWKIHIEYIALKTSKIVGLNAKLRHFVPLHTLLNTLHLSFFNLSLYHLMDYLSGDRPVSLT